MTMEQPYRNGAAVPFPDLRTEVKKLVTPAKLFMVLWSIILLLVTTDWLMVPAKSSDVVSVQNQLNALAAKVGGLEASVEKIAGRVETALDKLATKVDKIQNDQAATREEFLRGGRKLSAFSVEPVAARAVVHKKKRTGKKAGKPSRPVKTVKEAKTPGFFD
jgi:hypothetical protein